VTDRKNVATSGYKTVDHETKEVFIEFFLLNYFFWLQ